jgi:DNA processing protein
MKISETALNVLSSLTYKGIGRAWIVQHLGAIESPARLAAILNQSAKDGGSISALEFEERKEDLRQQWERLAGVVDGVVAIGDSDFPICRGQVKDSERPVALFYRGNLPLLEKHNKNVAVVGLLNPDEDTEVFEKQVVSTLVSYGVTIVSGLALGCDSIAHKEALLSGGKTIAVLPSPITSIVPAGNSQLAEEIVEKNGLLISEYYENAKSKMELSGRYIERDRLQALFSDCVMLSASYSKNNLGNDSGSRHAMSYARSYSVARAIMYDSQQNARNPKYDLNRQLIEEDRGVEQEHRAIVINRGNVQEAVQDIVSKHAGPQWVDKWVQKGLFS